MGGSTTTGVTDAGMKARKVRFVEVSSLEPSCRSDLCIHTH